MKLEVRSAKTQLGNIFVFYKNNEPIGRFRPHKFGVRLEWIPLNTLEHKAIEFALASMDTVKEDLLSIYNKMK